ncbi:hypothetical protein ERC79_10405 [Rhodococcus sp. ABRD24]|uniref:hypothetical protein n=1 Tax=Rhodococcus sp. ABRD24 TaxID=2507582 RepID=UPI00103DC1A4|nr:hypothetical protein [Rhodococcus sp. ABRD24]QBJ96330.1 hypothetical protein ERC79_10405 [Rhodococcus sp. ABRD24]
MRRLGRGRIAVVLAALAATTALGTSPAQAAPVPVQGFDTWALSEDVAKCGIVRIPMRVGLSSGWPGAEAYILLSPEFYGPDLTHRLTNCLIPVTVHWENLDTGVVGSRTVYPMDSRHPRNYQTSGNAAYVGSGLGRVRFWLTTDTPHVSAPPIEAVISL